ncbi:hypothetical protein GQ44DRAFT_762697 [Phaeosphaeriaceae sp. PMI808]|nr:hypothetical protein GQ44DRAFT_762697 [Phaeosphaeriaceae sp. PMI808]
MATREDTDVGTASIEVPKYILEHAPLVHLFSKDPYRPSSLAAQIVNTHPEIDFKGVTISKSPLTIDNIDQLNAVGTNGGRDVYLTSNNDITTNPKWLEGIQVDSNGGTGDEKTGVIVVVDKGEGIVDAFYFYFFAFNWGGIVLGKQLGDHVGDWEHNMIRFINGVPTYIWLSQHSNGEAFTFAAMNKDTSGKRPICYAANGSHALYPLPGAHDHTIPNLNLPTPFLLVDETDTGPIYDPTLSSYIYTYNTTTSTFTPYNPPIPRATSPSLAAGATQSIPKPIRGRKVKGCLGSRSTLGADGGCG